MTPYEIKNIRKIYDLSQLSFATMLGISVRTLQNYEIGHRVPSGTACALLKIAKEHPNFFCKHYLKDLPIRAFTS
jgi:putative transcriptional regulator